MDEHEFDILLRRVGRQTTRRAALATLLGGALLLPATAATDAADEAARGKQVETALFLSPISVSIFNPGPNTVTVGHGDLQDNIHNWYCRPINNDVPIRPGQRLRFASRSPDAYVWINRKYAFEFWNPNLKLPRVSAAVNGLSIKGSGPFCIRRGSPVFSRRPLNVDEAVNITINGEVFSVTRKRDSNYKEFRLQLPEKL